ncbi:MAG: helicase-related protein, partial [Vicinamibacterales bacterium]
SELSLTGPFVSRTRKVDVIPNKPHRVPRSLTVRLTEKERAVYLAVAEAFLRLSQGSSWGTSMALLTALRQTASCLPAAVRHFESRGVLSGWLDEMGWETPEEAELSGQEGESADLGAMESAVPTALPNVDSKFAEFRKALDGLWLEDVEAGQPRRKVIVFAFFRGTLDYLSERLQALDVNHRLIHGLVPLGDREVRINDFLNDADVRVLLSSEVGSEGVDLQVASVIVNYDLPWNPMVVEQRIGRIDRLGQRSPVLTVVNLVLENTIEDRILMRLYDRIDLFKNSIGEIDEILGDKVTELVKADLRRELTEAELARRVEQEGDAFVRERLEAERLQTEADGLLAGDQSFLDELQGLIGLRKVPGPNELYRFLSGFLDSRHPGCRVPREALTGTATADLQPALGWQLANAFPGDVDARRVAGLVQTGQAPLTFDSDAFLRVGRTEFVSMHHPLIRLCVHDLQAEIDTLHRAFQLEVPTVRGVDPGTYLLSLIELEVSGVRARTDLVPVAVMLGAVAACPREIAQGLFVATLEDDAAAPNGWADETFLELELAVKLLRREADAVRAEITRSESTLGAVRAARRRATLEGTLKRKVESARKRLRNLRDTGARDAVLRMEEGRVKKAEARLNAFLEETEPASAAEVAVRDVAVVLLSVGRAE